MRLKPHVTLAQATDHLNSAINNLGNARSGGRSPDDSVRIYLRAVTDSDRLLRWAFAEPDLAEGLYSPRYWHLLANGVEAKFQWPLGDEIDAQLAILNAAAEQLAALRKLADRPGLPLVYDTNMLLHWEKPTGIPWPQQLKTEQVRLVVPLVVIDELDRKKYADSSMAKAALKAIRMLEGLLSAASPGEPVRVRDGVTVEILIDEPGHRRHAEADMEIIERALFLEQITGAGVRLLTGDLNMKLRARSLGMKIFELDPKFKNQQQKRLLAEVEAEEQAAEQP